MTFDKSKESEFYFWIGKKVSFSITFFPKILTHKYIFVHQKKKKTHKYSHVKTLQNLQLTVYTTEPTKKNLGKIEV